MGIFKSLSKVSQAGFEAGAGFVKSFTDVPREFAELGSKIGSFASDAVDKSRNVQRAESPASRVFKKGASGTKFSRPTNPSQKAGFAAGEIAQLLTPAGEAKGAAIAGKLAKTLGGSERVINFASKLGGLSLNSLVQGGIATVQSGSPKEGAIVAGTNLAAAPILYGAGKIASGIAKTASSAFGGVPKEALEKAFRDPNAVRQAIAFAVDAGDDAMPQILEKTTGALDELQDLRSAAYKANLEDVIGSKVDDLSLSGARESLEGTLSKYRIDISGKGIVDATKSKLPSKFQGSLQELADELNNWEDVSPVGMDTLITRLQNLKQEGTANGVRQFNKIIDDVGDDLGKYVTDKVPAIAKLRGDYAKQSKLINEIREELLNGKDSTSIRKLANIFSPNNSQYRKIVNELGEKTGKDLMADIAGVILSKGTPNGLGKYLSMLGATAGGAGFATTLPGIGPAGALASVGTAALAGSPRAAGEIAAAAGRAAPAAPGAIRAAAGFIGKTIDALTGRKKTQEDSVPTSQTSQPPEAAYPQFQSQIQQAREQGVSDEEIMLYLQSKLKQ